MSKQRQHSLLGAKARQPTTNKRGQPALGDQKPQSAVSARFTHLRLLDFRDRDYARRGLLDYLNSDGFDYRSAALRLRSNAPSKSVGMNTAKADPPLDWAREFSTAAH